MIRYCSSYSEQERKGVSYLHLDKATLLDVVELLYSVRDAISIKYPIFFELFETKQQSNLLFKSRQSDITRWRRIYLLCWECHPY